MAKCTALPLLGAVEGLGCLTHWECSLWHVGCGVSRSPGSSLCLSERPQQADGLWLSGKAGPALPAQGFEVGTWQYLQVGQREKPRQPLLLLDADSPLVQAEDPSGLAWTGVLCSTALGCPLPCHALLKAKPQRPLFPSSLGPPLCLLQIPQPCIALGCGLSMHPELGREPRQLLALGSGLASWTGHSGMEKPMAGWPGGSRGSLFPSCFGNWRRSTLAQSGRMSLGEGPFPVFFITLLSLCGLGGVAPDFVLPPPRSGCRDFLHPWAPSGLP